MAAMKPRTGDGPLEVTKEGRGIVMRVPLEGGGRLVVELSGPRLSAFVEGLALGCYRFTRATRGSDQPPTTIELCGATDEPAVETGLRTAAAVAWARDLGNTRSGEKTPTWLGKQARRTL